jgi:gliding motility-associated-like protein
VSFKASVTGSPIQYLWFFGDGDSSTQKDPSHVYNKSGTFYPLLIVQFADGSSCKAQVKTALKIHEAPTADMNVTENQKIVLCGRGQKFCFKDMSKPGKSGAPLVQWVWSFGDGTLDNTQNPCYAYQDSGVYTVILEATDSNGCKNLVQRKIHIVFLADIGIHFQAMFRTENYYDCKKNEVVMNFFNLTDTAGMGITKFRWDFDDGTWVDCNLTDTSCLKEWMSQTHSYGKKGVYYPSLTIENKYGCKANYVWDTAVNVPDYKFGVEIYPDTTLCLSDAGQLYFSTPYHPYASYYRWDFGDPLDEGYGRTPGVTHQYMLPGTYTVTLEVKIGTCIYDTILCRKIRIYGPDARIMPNKKQYLTPDRTLWMIEPPISVSDYPNYFSNSCNAQDFVTYWVHDTTFIPKGDTTFSLCTADTLGFSYDSAYDCEGKKDVLLKKYNIKPGVVSIKDKVIPFATRHYWMKGTPYPDFPVFRDSVGTDSAYLMDDSMFVAPNCDAPHEVTFTNFSRKHRGYFAVDNDPMQIRDTCVNPAAPYASDSLQYEWDFKEGNPNISTRNFPDKRARRSEEVTPTHLFTKAGCYWVVLRTSDSLTGCYDYDSVPIVMQGADAGWDPSYHVNRMTWFMQDTLPLNSPREGMVLVGPPCVNTKQLIDLGGTLPSCFKPELAMVLDSAKDSKDCDTGRQFKWYSKEDIEKLGYIVKYQDTGWKTLAVVIRNNANCYDTMWYRSYKYFFKLFPVLEAEADHICVGDKIILKPMFPDQPGIRVHYSKFSLVGIHNDTLAQFGTDTLGYRILPGDDTATTTVHNLSWGKDDGSLNFNYLYDTIAKQINQPGHLVVKSWMRSRFGCVDSAIAQVTIGHYAEFSPSKQVLCAGDTVKYANLVRYFVPVVKGSEGTDDRDFWTDPITARDGRIPAKRERMEWDFDGDGTVDDTTSEPTHIYNNPGTYTVRLTTTDSTGCRQVLEKKGLITVISPVAKFSVDSPGEVRYCAPAFFRFIDSSYVVAPGDTNKKVKVYSWTWDYGDGSPPVTVYDPMHNSHFYPKNGDYVVKLTISTSPATGSGGKGCQSTYSKLIRILGPTADFEPITPLEGCVPFTVKFLNHNKHAAVQEWKQGDGINFSSNADTIIMRYNRAGTYCPSLIVADTIVDILGNRLYCKDSAPNPVCYYKVVVHEKDKFSIMASDTLLCAGLTQGTFLARPDTGYTSWWLDFGNGHRQSGTKSAFSYIYPDTGVYVLSMSGQGAWCPDTSYLRVRVIDVKALFSRDSNVRDTPVIAFRNQSRNGVRYRWDFGDGTPPVFTGSMDPVSHEFRKSGTLRVCLTAYNVKDCPDEYCAEYEINSGVYIPNVFTPQGDGANQTFKITIWGNTEYDLQIFNRWGQEVFHSQDRYRQWDGIDQRSGNPCVNGTYFYVFRYRLIGDKRKTVSGTVDLIR